MKEIKFILWTLFVAIYTSSWWALMRWGKFMEMDSFRVLLAVDCLVGFGIVVIAYLYLILHWNDDSNIL